MTESAFITRKEIGSLIERDQKTVERSEKTWGLDKCRTAGKRPVRYRRKPAMAALLRLNLLP